MINRKAIGYITANYSSTYGSVLLKDRPIASVPFLGRYRLIDFRNQILKKTLFS